MSYFSRLKLKLSRFFHKRNQNSAYENFDQINQSKVFEHGLQNPSFALRSSHLKHHLKHKENLVSE